MQHLSEALAEGGLVTANDRSRVLISGMNHRGRYRCQPSRPPGKARRPTRTWGLSPPIRSAVTVPATVQGDAHTTGYVRPTSCVTARKPRHYAHFSGQPLWGDVMFEKTFGEALVFGARGVREPFGTRARCERKKKARNNSCSAWLRRGWSTRVGALRRPPSSAVIAAPSVDPG